MLMFSDKSGDSVIIEGDEFVRKEGSFQVVTNFYQSRQENDRAMCPRFDSAVGMLEAGEGGLARPLPTGAGRDRAGGGRADAVLERLRPEEGARLPLPLPQLRGGGRVRSREGAEEGRARPRDRGSLPGDLRVPRVPRRSASATRPRRSPGAAASRSIRRSSTSTSAATRSRSPGSRRSSSPSVATGAAPRLGEG